jgi:ATP-dependent DNA ligase
MKVLKKSPILKSQAKSGKEKYWQLLACEDKGGFYYVKTWWQQGSKMQSSVPVQVRGKNAGRANETTDKEQLMLEFDSILQLRRDKGYSESGSSKHMPVKPMLANKYKDKKHTVTFPCFVQPKLDGFRMLKEGDGNKAWTRGGKPHVAECVKHLMWDTGTLMIDGELMLPDMPVLQETARAAKKFYPDVSPTLRYYVYDVVEPTLPFSQRYARLQAAVRKAPKNVVLVETLEVQNEEELFEAHAKFTSEGFEGTIVRTDGTGYEVGHRSDTLLKLKDFQDDEFKIVDVTEGKGAYVGKAIFVCETRKGVQFNAAFKGSMEERARLYKTRKQHIGKWLTVRYQVLQESGKPQFPVAVNIREEGEF